MIPRLERVKNSIELMTKFHQIEVLRILNTSEDVRLNENKNGVFINLSKVPEKLIEELDEYIKYVNNQETSLKEQETEKEALANRFFNSNKETATNVKISTRKVAKKRKDEQ